MVTQTYRPQHNKTIGSFRLKTYLFDLDGTLSESREKVGEDVAAVLEQLSKESKIGIVSGSGIDFIAEQIDGVFSEEFMQDLMIMPCNGTQRFQWRNGEYECVYSVNMIDELGRVNYADILARLLREQYRFMMDSNASLDCTGKFFDYRGSMLNWSPMGRNGNKETRKTFMKYDKENNYRTEVIEGILKYFGSQQIRATVKLGGDTSFDIYPDGWDKTYCLRHVESDMRDIYFFGDRCFPGGNDYELFKAVGKSCHVKDPADTVRILKSLI